MPFVIGVCCVIIKMYLFPNDCFGVFCGNWVVHCRPHIVPVNFTSEVILPFVAVVMIFIGKLDQSVINKFVGNELK